MGVQLTADQKFAAELNEIKSLEDLIEHAGKGVTPEMAERKANENLNSGTNTSWYDAYGIVSAIKDMTQETGMLMSRLSEGYEGDNLPVSYPVAFDVTDYFMLGKTEWANEARPSFDNQAVTDNKGTLTQVEFILQFGISDKMIKHSTDKQLFDKIVAKGSKAAVRTMESCIINGDNEIGATGNVNSDDQAPATTYGTAQYHTLKIDHGLRELAINNSNTFDVGAFDSDDLNSIRSLLGTQYMSDVGNLLSLVDPQGKLTIETDDAIKLQINTKRPTVDGAGTGLGDAIYPFGVEMISHPAVPLTAADGKADGATPANNVKGQIVMFWKPAVRHGFGQALMVETERVQGYGFEITVTMEWSFVILDGTNTVAVGRDITLI